ncbi:MAG: hypothetical protein NZ853_07415 [Leptospiraceae bacterium]|nr:hypothetical protein [Leptospiraceae bacterium]MDW7975737.1 hypothetical protein [Leptospiraceae bacterium]
MPGRKRKITHFRDLSNEENSELTKHHEEKEEPKEKPTKIINPWEDIYDPLTGELIVFDGRKPVYYCKRCSVFYQEESYQFILSQNEGCCVVCRQKVIIPYDNFEKIPVIQMNPDLVTLDDLPAYVGRVIKFRGMVQKILKSRRGDYALMFEDKPWVEGFKLVIFYNLINNTNTGLSQSFLDSLDKKTITVKGLLQNHEIFRYEILVFNRNMILSIE